MSYEIKNLLQTLKDQYYLSVQGVADAIERKELLQQCIKHYDIEHHNDLHIQRLYDQHLKQFEYKNLGYYSNWIAKYGSMVAELNDPNSEVQYPELIKNKMVDVLLGSITDLSEQLQSFGSPYANIAEFCKGSVKAYQGLVDEINEQLAFTIAYNSMENQ
jgi:hypothetical protein